MSKSNVIEVNGLDMTESSLPQTMNPENNVIDDTFLRSKTDVNASDVPDELHESDLCDLPI